MRRIDAYQGRGVTVFVLKLSLLEFLRPVEGRMAEWSVIDEAARLPAHGLDRLRTEEDLIG